MAPGVSDRIVRLTAEDVEQLMRAVALIITKLSENPNYGRFNAPSVNYAASGYAGGGGRGRGGGGPGGEVSVRPSLSAQCLAVRRRDSGCEIGRKQLDLPWQGDAGLQSQASHDA